MKKLFALTVSLLLIQVVSSQDTSETKKNKKRLYKTTITYQDQSSAQKGFLASLTDSSLLLLQMPVSLVASETNFSNYSKIDVNRIAEVRIRRKGTTGRSILHGALVGLGAGIVAGLAVGNDPPYTPPPPNPNNIYAGQLFSQLGGGFYEATRTSAGEKAIVAGFLGMFGGAAVGTLIGSVVHKTFIIGGNKEKFDKMKSKLL